MRARTTAAARPKPRSNCTPWCASSARAPAAAPARLSLHTGIHAGLVLVDEGDLVRGRFELLGNAPNIAARLSDAAEPDEILVSEETLGAEAPFLRDRRARQSRLKGAAAPLAVYRVLGRAPATTRFEARSAARPGAVRRPQGEIGRSRRRQDALAGRPAYVALSAGPGLGKTRLAEEFLRRAARDCQIHRGYCESYLSAEPLQPFLQMLRSLFRLDRGMSAVRPPRRSAACCADRSGSRAHAASCCACCR